MPSFDLTDRVAIVTGSSQGLGKATALELAKAGASVVIVAREPEQVTVGRSRPHAPVDPVAEEITALGRESLAVTADVRDQQQIAGMVEQTMAKFGRIDILVNVVGGSWGETFRAGPLMEIDVNDVMEAYRLNVATMFMCSVAVQPIMKRQGKGVIVNIASVAGRGPSPNQGSYGAAKAGVINMSLTMAQEWAPEIRVNAIAIGGIESPHRERWARDAGGTGGAGYQTALGRLGTPEEHAGTIIWLASDYGAYMTGAVIDAHGGRR